MVDIRKQNEEDVGRKKIVIVGGGFGGLAAAKALRNTPAKILLIDRTNARRGKRRNGL
jgi:NADH dehydrogenase FAD-containing subunit